MSRAKSVRIHEGDDESPTEASPLTVPAGESTADEGRHTRTSTSKVLERPSVKARRHWGVLRERVKGGDFLVAHDPDSRQKRRATLAREKEQEIKSGVSFTLTQSVVAIVVYECIAILCFSLIFEPQWTFIDSCYFSVVTFTTVGYGDIVPTTTASRIFTALYALLGVACMGVALGIIGSKIMEKKARVAECESELGKFQAMTLMDYSYHYQSNSSQDMSRSSVDRLSESGRRSTHSHAEHTFWTSSNMTRFIALLLPLSLLAFVVGYHSKWDFVETAYFLIVTMCTIGFGDFAPTSQTERLIAVFFIPLACAIMGTWLALVAAYIIDLRSARFKKRLHSSELTLEDLYVMDRNEDGVVTRADFFAFMLVSMGKIDEDTIDELDDLFDRLDVCGSGFLSKDDLIESARRKLTDSRRKVELAAYKAFLMKRMQLIHMEDVGDDPNTIWQSMRMSPLLHPVYQSTRLFRSSTLGDDDN